MKKIHYKKYTKEKLYLWAKVIGLIIAAIVSITLAIRIGNINSKKTSNFLERMDIEHFKKVINRSIPLIDMVYNSGNISISLFDELGTTINKMLGFRLKEPITLLNFQIPFLKGYYSIYQENYAQNLDKYDLRQSDQDNSKLLVDQSSISTEDEKEIKDFSKGNSVSKGKLSVYNETPNKIDIGKLVKEPLNIKFNKSGPKVLIYHTHTEEGYLKSLSGYKNSKAGTRSRDPEDNVIRVGEELAQNLRKKYGIGVIHNGTDHTKPSYVGAYSRSLNTALKILKSYPSIKIVLDIHRDGLGGGNKLRAVTKIKDKNVAKIMFVIGTDQTLPHPEWRENLKLALKLQEKLNNISPGLAKDTYISKNRYNQHLNNSTLIAEIGGDGNTIDEVLESTKYLAKVLNETITQ